ncbi:arylamine N-acetyltransferase family protein [Pontibacter ruber]|uniref:Arylamine N-acetyltransferase n=1 Tax=Pontibacter ruber TaxID=1343895 RepID=A0ABW5D4D9_9BACT|nr:arylamine N-acetyltransferase [Pontibacter ruber]
MNHQAYLDRIGYSGELAPTLGVLQQLQKTHLLQVPFENLDIHQGVPIELDTDKIFNKIVLQKRGGFCYELNGLFFELLTSLGFNARRISARVYAANEGDYTPEYDHMALIVFVDGEDYLSDVGFGEFSFAPLRIILDQIQTDERGNYTFDKYDESCYRVSRIENDVIIPEYIFRKTERQLNEFAGMCHFHQTDPASHFRQKKLITRPTEQGRITLAADKLKVKESGKTTEVVLKGTAEYGEYLWKYFSIKIPATNSNQK